MQGKVWGPEGRAGPGRGAVGVGGRMCAQTGGGKNFPPLLPTFPVLLFLAGSPLPVQHTLSPSLSLGYYGNKGVIDVG